jgi:DNA-binding XRE family transcriptional regulator
VKREELKKARLGLGLDQNEFAEMIGVSIDTVRSLEYGRVKPSSPVLLKICSTTKLAPEKLFPDMIK